MERRDFLKNTGLVVAGLASHNFFAAKNQPPLPKADFTLRIAPVSFDIAPAKTIHGSGALTWAKKYPSDPHQKRNGSSGRTRTYNPPVNSRMLCH